MTRSCGTSNRRLAVKCYIKKKIPFMFEHISQCDSWANACMEQDWLIFEVTKVMWTPKYTSVPRSSRSNGGLRDVDAGRLQMLWAGWMWWWSSKVLGLVKYCLKHDDMATQLPPRCSRKNSTQITTSSANFGWEPDGCWFDPWLILAKTPHSAWLTPPHGV